MTVSKPSKAGESAAATPGPVAPLPLRDWALELARRAERLAQSAAALRRGAEKSLRLREERLARLAGLLRTLGPESAFLRGFSITLDAAGRLVRSASALRPGDLLHTKFADGETRSRVEPPPTHR